VVVFCYLLIEELQDFDDNGSSIPSRPINYYKYHINSVIIVLNVLAGIARITGSIIIMFYLTILKIIRKRKELEVQESLINNEMEAGVGSCATGDFNNVININFNCHINNTILSGQCQENEKDVEEVTFDPRRSEKFAMKISSSYGSDDTYERKFETPCNYFMKNK
jgi:hypothetical protein